MSVLLIVAVAVLIVLWLERAHRSASPLQPNLIRYPGVDRDRQRVLDDLRWSTQAQHPAPTPLLSHVEAEHRDGDEVLPSPPTVDCPNLEKGQFHDPARSSTTASPRVTPTPQPLTLTPE